MTLHPVHDKDAEEYELKSRLPIALTRQLQTMAKTLRMHRRGLLNWYDHPLSTGPLEGINNKIGALQRSAYGYRNYDHLKERLLTLHHTKYTLQG